MRKTRNIVKLRVKTNEFKIPLINISVMDLSVNFKELDVNEGDGRGRGGSLEVDAIII